MAPILRTVNVTKRFGDFLALDEVSIAIGKGSVHGIIGPNGAGKTTLFNLLTGRLRPTSGQIYFCDEPIHQLSQHRRVHRGIGRSFQVTSLFQQCTVLENVRLAVQARRLRSAFNILGGSESIRRHERLAMDILERIGLDEVCEQKAGELSHGQQRTLEVGLALAAAPTLLLLDEPTSGVGVDDIGPMRALIQDVAREHTVVLIEHNMSVVMDVCERITVLHMGRVLMEGAPTEVRSDALVRSAYLGGEMSA